MSKSNRGNVIPRSQRTIVALAAKVLRDAPQGPPQPALVDDPDHPHTRIDPQFLDGVVQLTARMIGLSDVDTYAMILGNDAP
jgi:hypothetical protein